MKSADIIALAFGVAFLAGLVLAFVRHVRRQGRARRANIQQRARVAQVRSGSDAFDLGAVAALDGAPAWANPHGRSNGAKEKFVAWSAGWCYGRQLLRDAEVEIEP